MGEGEKRKNGKRGRPLKVYIEGEEPVPTMLRLPAYVRALVPEGTNLSRVVESLLVTLYEDKVKAEQRDLEEKIAYHESEAAKAKILLGELKRRIEVEEQLRKALRVDEKYKVVAFLALTTEKIGNSGSLKARMVHMTPEAILGVYGIKFDREKFEKDFFNFQEMVRQGELDPRVLEERYSIKFVKRTYHGTEIALRREIEEELGLTPEGKL